MIRKIEDNILDILGNCKVEGSILNNQQFYGK